MPNRDDEKLIRTPSFKAKLNQITGLAPEEKALVVRIGNLIDFLSFSQRQESNPKGRSRKVSPKVPVPQDVTATGIAGGVILEWSPVDMSELSFYEIQVDNDSVFSDPSTFENIDTRFVLKRDITENLFLRVRTITKRGLASRFSTSASVTVEGATITIDFDHIEPENRSTVQPKPTLIGETAESGQLFIGVGGIVAGSPLTMEDRHRGFPTTSNRRNEIAYDLVERTDPCNPLEERIMGLQDDFIERSSFYLLVEPDTNSQFYISTFIYPGSFVDFFQIADPDIFPSTLDVEFLRYRITNTFYQPDFAQAGLLLEGTFGAFRL